MLATNVYLNSTMIYIYTYKNSITTAVSEKVNIKVQGNGNRTHNNTSFDYYSRRLGYSFAVCYDSLFELLFVYSSIRHVETESHEDEKEYYKVNIGTDYTWA